MCRSLRIVSMQQLENGEGYRDVVAVQIPADLLTCMIVPVAPVPCWLLIPITDSLVFDSQVLFPFIFTLYYASHAFPPL